MVEIRTLTVKDGVQLLDLAREMHAESPRYSGVEFKSYKVLHMLGLVLNEQDGIGFVACEGERVVGFICGCLVEHFFSDARYASDLAVYVVPELRRAGIAAQLIKRFEEWAFAKGATEVTLGVSTGVNPDGTVRMYERLGYSLTSQTLVKSKG